MAFVIAVQRGLVVVYASLGYCSRIRVISVKRIQGILSLSGCGL